MMMKLFLTLTALSALGLAMIATARADGPTDELEAWPRLVTNVPKGTVNYCAGITIAYGERIEAQGFLGLATPSAHIETTKNAVDYNVFLAWKSVEMRDNFSKDGAHDWSYDKYLHDVPHEMRPKGGTLGVMAFDFRLSELCILAKARGMKKITFACNADKYDHENSKGETTSEQFLAECFISSFQAAKPSWKDLSNSRMGRSFSNHDTYEGADTPLDAENGRSLVYMPLIKWAVDSIVGEEADRKRAEAARHAAGMANCPQAQSLPIAPSAFPIAGK